MPATMKLNPSQRRVVLYSGGQERRNALIHETLLRLALLRRNGTRAAVRMTYMPYTEGGSLAFFRRFERRYRAFGGTHFQCVAADAAVPSFSRSRRDSCRSRVLSL